MGQIFGYFIFFAIIYYPFVKPLTLLNKGDKIIQQFPDNSKIYRQKKISIIITIYHFLISLLIIVFTTIKTFQTENNNYSDELFFAVIRYYAVLLTISICLAITLFHLINKRNNTQNILKLSYIIPIHCLIGVIFSLYFWRNLISNLDQKFLNLIPLVLILFELFYILSTYRFQKQTGLKWPKRNKNSEWLNKLEKNENLNKGTGEEGNN